MGESESEERTAQLNREVRDIWDNNAAVWDASMGEGGLFQRVLIGPATERLLNLQPGETVLDIAAGNGAFSRRMAELGAYVVSTDFSRKFLQLAEQRTTTNRDRIEYQAVDATDEQQLLALGQGRFDAAVCTMGIMDMAAIQPLFSALKKLLKPEGRFVFSVMHPCFNATNGTKLVVEAEDRDGQIFTSYLIYVYGYLNLPPVKGLGILEQPEPHYYFPRPLNVLFNTAFREGFVMDGIEEPSFEQPPDDGRPIWRNYKEIPPVLVARMRPLNANV